MSNDIHIPEIVPETVKSSGKIILFISLIGIVYLITRKSENEQAERTEFKHGSENSEPRADAREPQVITRELPEQNSDIGAGSEGTPNYIDHAIKRNKIITG